MLWLYAVLDDLTRMPEVLNNIRGHYTFTVPQGIARGNHLIRAEVIGESKVTLSLFHFNVFIECRLSNI